MATKVSVFGQQPTKPNGLKKIEFVKFLNDDNSIVYNEHICPKDWDNVSLVTKKHNFTDMDLMLGWYDNYYDEENKCISRAVLYLGHWNDGIV